MIAPEVPVAAELHPAVAWSQRIRRVGGYIQLAFAVFWLVRGANSIGGGAGRALTGHHRAHPPGTRRSLASWPTATPTARGAPKNLLQLGATFWHFRHESRATSPPIWAQDLIPPPLWALAKAFGRRPYHDDWDSRI
jgi:hypothetical protein